MKRRNIKRRSRILRRTPRNNDSVGIGFPYDQCVLATYETIDGEVKLYITVWLSDMTRDVLRDN